MSKRTADHPEPTEQEIYQAPASKRRRVEVVAEPSGGLLCLIHSPSMPMFKLDMVTNEEVEKGVDVPGGAPGVEHWKEHYGPDVRVSCYRIYKDVAM